MAALVRGVTTRLRSSAVFNDNPDGPLRSDRLVFLMPDGNPPNNFGQFGVVVHPLSERPDDRNALTWDCFYEVGITVTARMGYSPKDRKGHEISQISQPADVSLHLLELATKAARSLHQDDLHRIEANKLMPGTAEYVAIHGGTATVNGFLEPLRLIGGIETPRAAPPNWAGVKDAGNMLVVAVRMGDARLIQPIGG